MEGQATPSFFTLMATGQLESAEVCACALDTAPVVARCRVRAPPHAPSTPADTQLPHCVLQV
jgi:hypothetical protein